MESKNVHLAATVAALSVALTGCIYDTNPSAPGEAVATASQASTAYQYPYVGMAWHQGNRYGFAPSQVEALSSGYVYNSVIVPKMHRQYVNAGVVTTLAGTAGMSGGANGTGAAARFSSPQGVVMDGAGNLYVADMNNHTIRKVVVATGAVTTLAGTAGVSGSANGTGSAARFKYPQGIAIGAGGGNLYVADTNNHTIRKVVVSTGAVTTLVGTAGLSGSANGTGAAARFNSPGAVVTDGAGNLYVADTANHTIRKVVASTGAVTTLAGTAGTSGSADGTGPAALFSSPGGVAMDDAGNLYVADTGNHTIRKVVVATGAVTTLAGTAGVSGTADGTGAAALFSSPGGVAMDDMGDLCVADTGNHTIRKVVVATGAVTTLAGTAGMSGSADRTGAAAQFNYPRGVAKDGAGNLYVVDSSNHTIRKSAAEDYYTSLAWERDNGTWWSSQGYILGYFNAHYYCPRFAIAGYTVSNFSTSGGNADDSCTRTWNANSTTEAHAYVDAALQKIQDSGANGLYIDYPWNSSGLGPLAGYIITKATQMFGYNVVINTNSKATGALIEAKAMDYWTAHIEKAGPDFFDGNPAGESVRADEETKTLVNSTITSLWNQNPQLFQVQPTSIPCDPTAAYDTSTTTGNWQYLNYYQANACAGITCVYVCTQGYACTGNTDETLACGQ